MSNGNHLQNGHVNAADPSDDEYIDTVEVKYYFVENKILKKNFSYPRMHNSKIHENRMIKFYIY